MSDREFQKFLDHASEVVSKWPEWKRNILGDSAKSTLSSPRQPVNNFEPAAKVRRMNNLKPCPFCGGSNVHLERSPAGFPRWIVCIVCQAEGPPIEHDTKLSAEQAEQWVVEAWNRRATP